MKSGGSGGRPAVAILGTRGVPAAHGGFETLAERLALELVARGWRVEVYCQVREPAPKCSIVAFISLTRNCS